jgi:hypothetical protein
LLEYIRKHRCLIWKRDSIWSRHIASVSTGSPATRMASGRNGHRPIGNSSSTTSEHDFSNQTDVSFWSLIVDRMVLHFSRTNCASFSSPKVPGFADGKLCLRLIQTSARDLNNRGRNIALRCPHAARGVSTYNFQSEQSQPSICSSWAMSPAKML